MTIADSFNTRAWPTSKSLERACAVLAVGGDRHDARRHLATKTCNAPRATKDAGRPDGSRTAAATSDCASHGVAEFPCVRVHPATRSVTPATTLPQRHRQRPPRH